MASASSSSVNLLDLAAAALSSTIVAADQIIALAKPDSEEFKNSRLKSDGSIVTDADLAAQGVIVQTLHKVSTDVRLVGEESEDEMAQHSQNITGHEERAQQMFRLAQQEILIRYNRSDEPLPLAQTKDVDPETSSSSTSSNDHAPEATKLEDYVVDSSRVAVFIDPLDGTKAYAKGDYAPVSILVAIILDDRPCFGVICKPFGNVLGQPSILDTGCVAIYGGNLLGAAYAAGGPVCTFKPKDQFLPRAVISSSRSGGIVEEYVKHLGSLGMIDPEPMMISGAGEKSLRLVLRSQNEGLWFFPKPGTSLWDVAASDALLRATGGKLTDKNGNELDYTKSRTEAENKDGLIACFDQELHTECLRIYREGTWSHS